MASVKISQSDIDQLAKKLDELGEVLSNTEKAILLGVFGLAAAALSGAAKQTESGEATLRGNLTSLSDAKLETGTSLPKLSDGFRTAFDPSTAGKFAIGRVRPMEDVGVGGSTVTWTR